MRIQSMLSEVQWSTAAFGSDSKGTLHSADQASKVGAQGERGLHRVPEMHKTAGMSCNVCRERRKGLN